MEGVLRGKVTVFDEHRGTGEIEAPDGRRFPFHCTALADGSRRVPVGSAVAFAPVPGRLGRVEAADVQVID